MLAYFQRGAASVIPSAYEKWTRRINFSLKVRFYLSYVLSFVTLSCLFLCCPFFKSCYKRWVVVAKTEESGYH